MRRFIFLGLLFSIAPIWILTPLLAQQDRARLGDNLHQDLTWFTTSVDDAHDPDKRQRIATPADWQHRRAAILQGMQQAMGKLPEKTQCTHEQLRKQLDLEVIESEEHERYLQQVISFRSPDGDRIPALLLMPTGNSANQKLPAMLALHPTGSEGKRIVIGKGSRVGRQYASELAERGYVVLCPDYPSFGDYPYDFDGDQYESGTMKGIVNHICCVDLLSTLEIVDPERIGVIGHSLGGHNAMFVGALDERLKVIVSSCGWTPFHDYYDGKIAGWTSPRYMPLLKTRYELNPDLVPFDFYEIVAALAPRAFYSCSPLHDDNFAVTGIQKAIPAAAEIFKLLGAETNLQVHYPDCGHDFPTEEREDAYRFIDQVLAHKPSATGTANHWRAGIGRAKITPPQFMWMSGYASRTQPADGTLHDLWAKALWIDCNADAQPQSETTPEESKPVLLITLDLVGINRGLSEKICRAIETKHGLSREQIAICCSHTHTGPVVGDNLLTMYFLEKEQVKLVEQYAAFLQDQILAAVDQANNDLAPAVLAAGNGHTDFAVNRRNNVETDVPGLREAQKLQGPVDHDVPVLTVRSLDGGLRAIVFGYACHATVLSLNQWSGDWPGFAQIELEKTFPDATALFWAGCGADQNPLPRRTVELAEKYGKQMSAAVADVIGGEMQPLQGNLQSHYQEIELQFAELPSNEKLLVDAASSNRYESSRAKHLLAQIEKTGELSPAYPYPIQHWQIGQLDWMLLGGEVVVDYALRLKADFPDRQIWIASYANDVMAYIPSRRVLAEGGYEGGGAMLYYGLPSPWAEDIEERIMKACDSMLETNSVQAHQ
jgi:acetyl esterase/lipase